MLVILLKIITNSLQQHVVQQPENIKTQTNKPSNMGLCVAGFLVPPPTNPSLISALQYRKYCDELSSEAHDDDVVP